jgi:hypothetical protein
MKTVVFKVGKVHISNPFMAVAVMFKMPVNGQVKVTYSLCDPAMKTIAATFDDKDERIVRAMIDLYEAVYVDGEK